MIGADNASVCRRLARLMNVPFNGCRSHRLSLAAKRLFFMGDHDERPIHRALIKSRRLMVKLSQLKNASLLKAKTPLKAVRLRLDTQTLFWGMLRLSALSPARSTATSPTLRPRYQPDHTIIHVPEYSLRTSAHYHIHMCYVFTYTYTLTHHNHTFM